MSIIETVPRVDLQRYSGDWYVQGHIPAFLERNATNAVERYDFQPPNRMATTFSFNDKTFDGPRKVYQPLGFVDLASGGGLWGMQFVWPIKAEFRVSYLSADYEHTIIGRSKRDYVWIMTRQPVIDDATYAQLVQKVADLGYDIQKLRRVPQQPASERRP